MMMATILMMFIFNLALVITKWNLNLPNDNIDLCKFLGFVIQYSYISAIFWLNSIGHKVWSDFKELRLNRPLLQVKCGLEDRKFKRYATISWGCPLILTLVTILLQMLPAEVTRNLVTPRIGMEIDGGKYGTCCSIAPDMAMFYYFHIINTPVMVRSILQLFYPSINQPIHSDSHYPFIHPSIHPSISSLFFFFSDTNTDLFHNVPIKFLLWNLCLAKKYRKCQCAISPKIRSCYENVFHHGSVVDF